MKDLTSVSHRIEGMINPPTRTLKGPYSLYSVFLLSKSFIESVSLSQRETDLKEREKDTWTSTIRPPCKLNQQCLTVWCRIPKYLELDRERKLSLQNPLQVLGRPDSLQRQPEPTQDKDGTSTFGPLRVNIKRHRKPHTLTGSRPQKP